MRPKVVIQTEVSVDGSIHGFAVHMGQYYGIAASLGADAEMIGSETMLAAEFERRPEREADWERPVAEAGDGRHLWFVPDSRGRLEGLLHQFRDTEWCLDVVPLISQATPPGYREYLATREYGCIQAGAERVDLGRALAEMGERFGVQKVRVDSGGVLNNALLARGLVDEVSLLLSPVLVSWEEAKAWRTLRIDAPIELRLEECERLAGGLVHLRYAVVR
jgi:2,5-diamino-6-(ribosylamino)-4(3H)-pyrimidinone 5'-phosphate reductase